MRELFMLIFVSFSDTSSTHFSSIHSFCIFLWAILTPNSHLLQWLPSTRGKKSELYDEYKWFSSKWQHFSVLRSLQKYAWKETYFYAETWIRFAILRAVHSDFHHYLHLFPLINAVTRVCVPRHGKNHFHFSSIVFHFGFNSIITRIRALPFVIKCDLMETNDFWFVFVACCACAIVAWFLDVCSAQAASILFTFGH